MRVRIYPLALGKAVKYTMMDLEREVAGLLIGKYEKRQDILEIWDAISGNQKSSSAFVYLDEEVMAATFEWLTRERPGLSIVGWYHSHPGFDLFLSTIDIETQRRYQMMFPKAVAMVIDPLEYVKTRRLVDLKFKVFHIDREGRVVPLRVSIGIQRKKVIESTIRGMDTVDLFFIQSPEPQEREEYKFTAFSSLGEKFKKLKERFTSF
ncbi:MAG: Mov34/MPN/PAD-1 family protein [Thaumarchaeota archaeon]|nr:Mov34/MPN/PAD-1 family protein [Candidatus Geocrenenecus arthurdayi]MCL7388452.1 Mov34/MPN/PAD-1 family protein [Candidatus Geocrenenecus arthurdayi]MCL7390847.1 Mov34/MPN/PAD-1 family protein [Candidatus Geocrenenecus arthurdayi]MCL7396187.1 Mov34/MPN/PAD-1 family protein [Candidatus Geocrenenecus arthurdayi]MCL7401959.1 Mov34/MPN/PAD-1 family protein [Candidatus Geocrenenecus arthurdayi]